MHGRTPRLGGWSLRTAKGEYVTDVATIFALMSQNSKELAKFQTRLAGKTIVDELDEDPVRVLTTSSVIDCRLLKEGTMGFTTSRLHEYIVRIEDVDPEWAEIIEKVDDGLLEDNIVDLSKKKKAANAVI